MKRVIAVLLAAAFSCVITAGATVKASDNPPKEEPATEAVGAKARVEKMMPEPAVQLKRLTEGLQLTEEQQKQIKPILEDEYAKLKEIQKNENIAPKQIQTKVEALRTETITKINAFLTPDQKEKYKAVSSKIKSQKQKRMQDNRKSRIGTNTDQPAQ